MSNIIRLIKSLFNKNIIGWAVLKPYINERFASTRMTPRYDHNGNIYMLICDDRIEVSHE